MKASSLPQGPGFLPTFCYYSTSVTLIATFVSAQVLGMSLSSGLPYRLGLIAGLSAGVVGGYLNHSGTLYLEFANRKTFTATLDRTLAEMGYAPTSDWDDFTVYQRSGLGRLFSGKIFVKIDKRQATLVSRSVHLKQLHRQIDSPQIRIAG